MKRFVLLAFAIGGAAACGDNPGDGDDDTVIDATAIDGAAIDGAAIDGPDPDATPDASADGPPPQFSGTITVLEAQVLASAGDPVNTVVAQGIQIGVTFTDPSMAVATIFDSMPGSDEGCKVTELTPAMLPTAANLGVNEGTLTFAFDNPPVMRPQPGSEDRTLPACSFFAGAGYLCDDPTSSQPITAVDTVTLDGSESTTLMTVVGSATFVADDVGRYVKFASTGNPSLDSSIASFPIVALGPTENTAVLGGSVTATVSAGSLTTLAGAGPFPGLADPGQLPNDARVVATLVAGGGNHFPDTTLTWGNVGDDFAMDDANADRLRNVPTDGSAFTLSCLTGSCGTSIATLVSITTTDAPVTGLALTAMPPPVTKRVNIRCAFIGPTSITIPTSVSAFLMTSGATRIQTSFIRGMLAASAPTNAGLWGTVAGHALIGFTTVTPP